MAFNISYKFKVLDGFSRELKKFQKITGKIPAQMAKVAASTSKSFRKMGDSIRSLRDKTAIASAGMIAGFVVAAKEIGNFQVSMNEIEAASGATAKEMKALRKAARLMGATTQFSAGEAADGLAQLAKAGFKSEKAIKTLPAVLNLAAAGSLSMAEAASIMTASLAGFGLEATETTRISDVFAKAAASAKTDVSKMGFAISKVAPIAAGFGISLEATAASIAALQDAGIAAETSGTGMRKIFNVLAASTKDLRKSFKGTNVDIKGLSELMKKGDLTGAFEKLNKAQIKTSQLKAIFGEEFAALGSILINSSKKVKTLEQSFLNAKGAADKMAKIKTKGLFGELKKLSSAFSELLFKALVDTGFITTLTSGITKLTNIISNLSKSSPILFKIAVGIGLIIAAAAPLLAILGVMASGVAVVATGFTAVAALSPFGLAIIGLTAFSAGLAVAFQDVRLFFGFMLSELKILPKAFGFLFDDISKSVKGFFGISTQIEKTENINQNVKINKDITKPQDIGMARQQDIGFKGSIDVTASGGARVTSAESQLSGAPGNLGFNLVGAE